MESPCLGCTELEPGTIEYKIMLAFLSEAIPKPSDLAKSLAIPHQTINSALKRLSDQNMVKWERYKNIELLPKGKEMLEHIETHLHLIEIYLVNSLGLGSEAARLQALALAPHFTCDTIKKICDKYKHPSVCPNHKTIHYSASCHSHENHAHEAPQ